MLTEKEMLTVAERYISELAEEAKIEVVIPKEAIVKKPYGNVYFYTSKKYYETGDFKYAIAGNAPFLVEKKTGKIVEFGTAKTQDYYIQQYEAGNWPVK